jgi:hypothetical protein
MIVVSQMATPAMMDTPAMARPPKYGRQSHPCPARSHGQMPGGGALCLDPVGAGVDGVEGGECPRPALTSLEDESVSYGSTATAPEGPVTDSPTSARLGNASPGDRSPGHRDRPPPTRWRRERRDWGMCRTRPGHRGSRGCRRRLRPPLPRRERCRPPSTRRSTVAPISRSTFPVGCELSASRESSHRYHLDDDGEPGRTARVERHLPQLSPEWV